MTMIGIWWRRAEKEHHNVTEPLRQFLEGRVPPPPLVTFDPEYRALSDHEATEALTQGTLGGRPVHL